MTSNSNLPSYEEIFGTLDFKRGDEARSVLSSAAYLVDLLQLLDDNLKTNFHQRRSDIKNLLMNQDNTFTSIPYLNIVNEVLETQVGDNSYRTLRTSKYPFNLPFNFENERIKTFFHYLDVTSGDLYKLFSLEFDGNIIAREYLKLS
ncbi:MAG TPA: Tc toxin subunit A, partial [Candidatus Obscuribacterales bacterium]